MCEQIVLHAVAVCVLKNLTLKTSTATGVWFSEKNSDRSSSRHRNILQVRKCRRLRYKLGHKGKIFKVEEEETREEVEGHEEPSSSGGAPESEL